MAADPKSSRLNFQPLIKLFSTFSISSWNIPPDSWLHDLEEAAYSTSTELATQLCSHSGLSRAPPDSHLPVDTQ